MASFNINSILGKLDELRAVFILGQRAVPFLEEIFSFLKEISPLLDEINRSIQESTHKMPHATNKLQSVTEATELATTEILDLVDAALLQLGEIKGRTGQVLMKLDAIGRADARMIRLLRAGLKDKDEALLAQIEMLHEEKKALRRGIHREVKVDIEALDKIRDKLNRIMISLQVQDITAQQIAAVNHLIESIRDRMARLVTRLASNQLPSAIEDVGSVQGPVTFDPNAVYDRSGRRQREADRVVAAFDQPEPEGDGSAQPASQDVIDQLFDQNGQTGEPAQTDSEEKAGTEPGASGAPSQPASQDMIDQLFSQQQGASSAVVSQEEIDKLFQSGQ